MRVNMRTTTYSRRRFEDTQLPALTLLELETLLGDTFT